MCVDRTSRRMQGRHTNSMSETNSVNSTDGTATSDSEGLGAADGVDAARDATRIRPIDSRSLAQAVSVIRAGGLIVLPTDTVYGVACDPFNPLAVRRIFSVKHRPQAKTLQVLLASTAQISELRLTTPAPLDTLSRELLPGGFSPICVARVGCRLATLRNESSRRTQAVRVPDSEATSAVLRATGPLAASSANRSGKASAQTAQQAFAQLGDGVSLYLDGGPTPGPKASTVVAASSERDDGIVILREGVIPAAAIHRVIAGAARGNAGRGR